MNAEQRKFLIKKITDTYNAQKSALEEQVPEEPTFNRHIISAILEGTLKVKDAKTIKENITKLVKNSKEETTLINEEDNSYYGYNRRRKSDYTYSINAHPEVFFVMPKSYEEAKGEYEKKKAEVDERLIALKTEFDTLVLKIQIGSNVLLDKLITEVDSLGDISIFNNRLNLLAEGIQPNQKQLSNSNK